MAQPNKNTPPPTHKATGEEANKLAYDMVMTSEEQKITMNEAFDIVEATESNQMVDLSSSFLKMELGKRYVFLVRGVESQMIKGKQVDVVKLENKDGQVFVGGDKMLVDAAKRLTQIPCFLKVFFKEEKSSPMGKYKFLEISTFATNID